MHTKIQKERLWQSVEHYLENWQDIYTANIGSSNCACCQEWANNDCEGCPIMQHTGEADCVETPWHAVYEAMHREHPIPGERHDRLEAEYRFLAELALQTDGGV